MTGVARMTSVARWKGGALCDRALKPVSAAAFSLAILCRVRPALAEAAFTERRTQVSLDLETGRVLNGDDNAPLADIYDFGVGLGAGHTLSAGVYFGVTFDYFLKQDGIGSTAQLLWQVACSDTISVLATPSYSDRNSVSAMVVLAVPILNGSSKADSKLVWVPGLKALFSFGHWFVSELRASRVFDTPDEQSGDAVEKGLHASGVIASLGGGLAF